MLRDQPLESAAPSGAKKLPSFKESYSRTYRHVRLVGSIAGIALCHHEPNTTAFFASGARGAANVLHSHTNANAHIHESQRLVSTCTCTQKCTHTQACTHADTLQHRARGGQGWTGSTPCWVWIGHDRQRQSLGEVQDLITPRKIASGSAFDGRRVHRPSYAPALLHDGLGAFDVHLLYRCT